MIKYNFLLFFLVFMISVKVAVAQDKILTINHSTSFLAEDNVEFSIEYINKDTTYQLSVLNNTLDTIIIDTSTIYIRFGRKIINEKVHDYSSVVISNWKFIEHYQGEDIDYFKYILPNEKFTYNLSYERKEDKKIAFSIFNKKSLHIDIMYYIIQPGFKGINHKEYKKNGFNEFLKPYYFSFNSGW